MAHTVRVCVMICGPPEVFNKMLILPLPLLYDARGPI